MVYSRWQLASVLPFNRIKRNLLAFTANASILGTFIALNIQLWSLLMMFTFDDALVQVGLRQSSHVWLLGNTSNRQIFLKCVTLLEWQSSLRTLQTYTSNTIMLQYKELWDVAKVVKNCFRLWITCRWKDKSGICFHIHDYTSSNTCQLHPRK